MEVNRKMRALNQLKLRDLAHNHHGDVRIFSAHDSVEFEDFKTEPPRLLAGTSDNFENVLWMRRNLQDGRSLH
jgi:hypothetical protein